ncbi:hypothetical protein ACJQ62_004490, partial [Yersinia enterocolitica]
AHSRPDDHPAYLLRAKNGHARPFSGLVVDSVPFMFCFSPTALSPPRMTGDGFYEAVNADPDGNRVELVGCDLLKNACRSLYRVV